MIFESNDVKDQAMQDNTPLYTNSSMKSFDGVQPAMFTVKSHDVCSDWFGNRPPVYAKDKKILLKHSENEAVSYLSIVNNSYKVIENKDWAAPIHEQMISSFGEDMFSGNPNSCETKTTLTKNGAVTFVYYTFPAISTDIFTTNGHATSLKLKVIVKNTFDSSGKLLLYIGNIDSFCANGLITGQYNMVSHSHRSSFKVLDFTSTFKNALKEWRTDSLKYRKMALAKVKDEDVWNLIYQMCDSKHYASSQEMITLPPNELERTLSWKLYNRYLSKEKRQRGSNIFSVMSTLTHYSSHNSDDFDMRRGNPDTIPTRIQTRQEKVAKWMDSKVWNNFVAQRVTV